MGWQRHLVAAFVAFHAFTIVYLSLPRPEGPGTPEFEAFAGDVRAWAPSLEPAARVVTRAYLAASGAIRAGLLPYARWAGTSQGWTMFGTVPTECERAEIHVRRGREWAPLYVAGSDEHDWRRGLFENERVRTFLHSAAKPGKPGRQRVAELADWAEREVKAADPTVEAVRVQYVRVVIPPPDELALTGTLRDGPVFRSEARPRRGR